MKTAQVTRLQHSIIRRSLSVVVFYVFGHMFNYLLLVTTNRMLPPDVFGLFYICISAINVLVTPGLTLVWSFAQQLSTIAATGQVQSVIDEFWRILRLLLRWGTVIATAVGVALVTFGRIIGVESVGIIVFIPVIALASLAIELNRGAFQALQRFGWFSASWVLWCALQYVFAVIALYVAGTVWSGLIGLLLAALVMSCITLPALSLSRSKRVDGGIAPGETAPMRTENLAPIVGGYGLFTLFVNTDVLLAYLLLGRDQLGTYVASSVLPKAIITATLPVAQVLLPVVVARAKAAESTWPSMFKALTAVVVLATAGVLVLNAGGGLVCNSRLGLRFCDIDLMAILSLTAIPLCVLRVLVVGSLALTANWLPMLQLLGIVLVATLAMLLRHGTCALAMIYLGVCSSVALFYLAINGLLARRRLAMIQT